MFVNDARFGSHQTSRGEEEAMNLGFFTMPIHPPEKDWRLSLKEDREAFLLADELGFTEGYVGEHITDRAENITSCIAFIAWIAAATKQIKLGTGTINMPNTHPAAVAAGVAMLDHMLEGRLILGISPGGLLSDAELFGNLDANRNEMFLESINQVLDIWAGEPPYNFQGKYWNISTQRTLIRDIGQGYIARPLQRPHPPIVVAAVAPFSKGVTEAAASAAVALPILQTGALQRASLLPGTRRRQGPTRPTRPGLTSIIIAHCSPN